MTKRRSERGRETRQRDLISLRGRESSSIAVAVYDEKHHKLRLQFRPGGIYDYRNVPSRVIDEAIEASSLGQFVNWRIKPYYEYKKVS
jgi:hypothetical protein